MSASEVPNHPEAPDSPLPPALRWAGPFLAAGFAFGVGLRRLAYGVGLKKSVQAPLPVISIGNLSAGGTGKTPATAFVAKGLLERGFKPAILTRGYGSDQNDGQSDEARELARVAPKVPIIVNPSRVHGAQLAKQNECNVAVLDDGFQHWQIKRELDIVLIDATRAFETAHRLPWGYLRENKSALGRAGVVVITRADQVEPARLEKLTGLIKSCSRERPLVVSASHRPVSLRNLAGTTEFSLEALRDRNCYAACGLGNPRAFFKTLEKLNAKIKGTRSFTDHHAFSAADCMEIAAQAKAAGAEALAITEKDAAKWEAFGPQLAQQKIEVWVLRVAFELTSPSQVSEFWAKIEQAIRGR